MVRNGEAMSFVSYFYERSEIGKVWDFSHDIVPFSLGPFHDTDDRNFDPCFVKDSANGTHLSPAAVDKEKIG